MALQLRRGVDADRSGITPAEGELIYVTDTKKVWIGDGSTVGGIEFALSSNLQNLVEDVSPQLGGNLDLNSNNIIGVGNIEITGTVTATGNINLGDNTGGDEIVIGGELTGGLVPSADGSFDIGTGALRWNTLNANSANISGQIDALTVNASLVADDSTVSYNKGNGTFSGALVGNVTGDVTGNLTGNLIADDSTVVVDANQKKITGDLTGNAAGNHTGTFTGEVTGSVFGDDSTVLVDGVANKIVGSVETLSAKIRSGGSIARDLTRTFDTVTSDKIYDSSADKLTAQNIDVQTINATGTITGTFSGNVSGALDGEVTGSVFGDDSTLLVDGIDSKIVGDYENGVSIIDADSMTTATINTIGNETSAVMRLQRTASSALGDDDSIATTIYRENEDTPYWTVGVAKNWYNISPNPTGTSDPTKFLQVYKDGRVQIGGEAGGSGYQGWLRQPTADLEVYGNVHITDAKELLLGSMTTTQRNALTAANGMIIYNTTDNKFQGYENGSWANLI